MVVWKLQGKKGILSKKIWSSENNDLLRIRALARRSHFSSPYQHSGGGRASTITFILQGNYLNISVKKKKTFRDLKKGLDWSLKWNNKVEYYYWEYNWFPLCDLVKAGPRTCILNLFHSVKIYKGLGLIILCAPFSIDMNLSHQRQWSFGAMTRAEAPSAWVDLLILVLLLTILVKWG